MFVILLRSIMFYYGFSLQINDANEVTGQRCCIAYEECLVNLARLASGQQCELAECSARVDIKCKTVGTAMIIDWVCVHPTTFSMLSIAMKTHSKTQNVMSTHVTNICKRNMLIYLYL